MSPNREELKEMLLDIVDNNTKPTHFEGSQNDWKREWLFAVADVAVELAKQVPID